MCNREIHAIEKIDEHTEPEQEGDVPPRANVCACRRRTRRWANEIGLSHQAQVRYAEGMARSGARARGCFAFCPRRMLSAAVVLAAAGAQHAFALTSNTNTSIFSPASTPSRSIYDISLFVLAITGGIFVVVGGLIVYAAWRFRQRPDDDGRDR